MNIFNKILTLFKRKERFFRNKLLINIFLIGFLVNLSTWVFLFITFKPQTDPIFLHYNIYFGVDLIGQWYHIFIYLPAIGFCIYLVNLLISYILYSRERILSYSIGGLNIFIQLVIFVSSYLIARQN